VCFFELFFGDLFGWYVVVVFDFVLVGDFFVG